MHQFSDLEHLKPLLVIIFCVTKTSCEYFSCISPAFWFINEFSCNVRVGFTLKSLILSFAFWNLPPLVHLWLNNPGSQTCQVLIHESLTSIRFLWNLDSKQQEQFCQKQKGLVETWLSTHKFLFTQTQWTPLITTLIWSLFEKDIPPFFFSFPDVNQISWFDFWVYIRP